MLGLGHVGSLLATRLAGDGGILTVTDVNPVKRQLAARLGAQWTEPDEATRVPGDLFVPAGVGGILTPEVVDGLQVRAVCGPANNQLAERSVADLLRERGIAWAPDFVVNAGGVIFLDTLTRPDASAEATRERVEQIGDTVAQIFEDARDRDVTTLAAAEALAMERLDAVPVLV